MCTYPAGKPWPEEADAVSKFAVLNCNKDFRTLYYRGKSQVHPALVTYVRRNRLGRPRAGITTGKKIGNAVCRNRCRRIICEAYRHLLPSIEGGWDFVFVARGRTLSMKSTDLERVMSAQLRAAGVLQGIPAKKKAPSAAEKPAKGV